MGASLSKRSYERFCVLMSILDHVYQRVGVWQHTFDCECERAYERVIV